MLLLAILTGCGTPAPEAVNPDVEAIVMNAPPRAERPGYRFQLIVPRGAPEGNMKPETTLPPLLAVLEHGLEGCDAAVGARVTGSLHLDGLGGGTLRASGDPPAACFDNAMKDVPAKGVPDVALDLPWAIEITALKGAEIAAPAEGVPAARAPASGASASP